MKLTNKQKVKLKELIYGDIVESYFTMHCELDLKEPKIGSINGSKQAIWWTKNLLKRIEEEI